MRCFECGKTMEQSMGTYRYEESGLKNVLLVNIPMFRCPGCKTSEVEIPHMEELHLLLGFLTVLKPQLLKGNEVRFLRKHLGYSQEELADRLGVTRVTVARWEAGKGLRADQDKHCRRLYLEKKHDQLGKRPEVGKILHALIDRLPLDPRKKECRIRAEDWIPRDLGDAEAVPA